MNTRWTKEQLLFIEEMARTCEQMFGMPRMSGRIWAVLLITDREYLSAEELMDDIQASRGTVSTMIRILENIGLVKRVKLRGDRKHYYSASEADALMRAELGSIKLFIRLMEAAARAVDRDNRRAKDRLEDISRLMEFFASEYAALLERWNKQRTTQ